MAKRNIDWDRQPLGEVPDGELARTLGVPRENVRQARLRRHIPTKRSPGIDWDRQPLGALSDTTLGRRLGVSAAAVAYARNQRGLAVYQPTAFRPGDHCKRNIDWDGQPLGRVPDVQLAATLGVSKVAVGKARQKRGIPPLRDVDWDRQPLGLRPDAEIAQALGIARATVQAARLRQGLAPVHRDRAARHIDWDRQPLGQVADEQIARRLGVSHADVYWARKRRGILAAGRSWTLHEVDGQQRSLNDWAKTLGSRSSTVYNRLRRGWSIRWALLLPAERRRIDCDGKSLRPSEWSKITGLSASLISNRVYQLKWPAKRALSTPAERIDLEKGLQEAQSVLQERLSKTEAPSP